MTTGGTLIVGSTTLSFNLWEGQIKPNQPKPDIYRRLGQIGSGSQSVGSQGPISSIIAHYFTSTDADAIAMRSLSMGVKGSYGVAYEPDGNSATVLVVAVIANKSKGKFNLFGVQWPIRTTVQWSFEAQ